VNRREFLALAAGAPFAVRAGLATAAPSPARVALVTCDADARLAIVDLVAFRVVGSIPTLPDPRAVERVGRRALVCHTAAGAVSIVGGGHVETTLHAFEEPRYTAAHPDGRHAFVTDSGRSGVTAVDVVRGRVVGHVRLGGWARHVSLDPRGMLLWVSLGSASPQVAVVDAADPRHLRRLGTVRPPFGAHDVVFAPDGRHVWVTSGDRRETAIYGRRGELQRRLGADGAPQHVTFGDGVAFVTSGADGTLRMQARADGAVLRTASVPRGSYNVQFSGARVVTPSLDVGTLAVLDGRGRPLARVRVAGSCHDACVLPAHT
jgi:DNA-binding beta-propeller fold protein YncE